MFGVPDGVALHFRDLFVPDERERGAPGAILDLARETGAWDGAGWRHRAGREPFWGALSVTWIETPNQVGIGYMVVARDLSALRDQAVLPVMGEEAGRLLSLGRIASDVSHDVRNILTAIRGFAGLLERHLGGGSTSAMVWYELVKACDRGTNLTRKVLSMGRANEGEVWEADLSRIVMEMEPLLRQLLPKRIELRVGIADDTPVVRARSSELELVLLNLVVNARDAIEGQGRVKIDLRPSTTGARLTVSDTGCGMAPEVVEQVFERAFTTKPSDEGTGLGLSLVRSAVQEAGGKISVDSAPGRGTSIALDFNALRVATTGHDETDAARLGSGSVLVCSAGSMSVSLSRLLRAAGYDVVVASSADDLAELLGDSIDVGAVVVDMALGDHRVRPIIGVLESEAPALPVLGISGPDRASDLPGHLRWSMLRGVVSPDVLLARIDGLIEGGVEQVVH